MWLFDRGGEPLKYGYRECPECKRSHLASLQIKEHADEERRRSQAVPFGAYDNGQSILRSNELEARNANLEQSQQQALAAVNEARSMLTHAQQVIQEQASTIALQQAKIAQLEDDYRRQRSNVWRADSDAEDVERSNERTTKFITEFARFSVSA